MKSYVFLIVCFAVAMLVGCMATIPVHTEADLQQLEDAKNLFISQLENDMHPAIWEYLDEVLHDPDSFRLQRFEYTITNHHSKVAYKERTYLLSKETETFYKYVVVPAYTINMRYRVRVPAGGFMLKQTKFFLFEDKRLRLPSGVSVSLSE